MASLAAPTEKDRAIIEACYLNVRSDQTLRVQAGLMPGMPLKPVRRVYIVRKPLNGREPAYIPPDLVIVDEALDEKSAREIATQKLCECRRVDRATASQIFHLEFIC